MCLLVGGIDMEEQRRRPEDFLETIGTKERKENKGQLRIFFGYAAGVGKTYTMLKAARKAKKDGVDVVCGYIEPHSRPDTMKLLEGLEQIPVKDIEYSGILLHEMDLDAILERKPQLVVVDEYAHTNAYGSRHEKRYQDVQEILNAGIDVYTTINVQHIESLCDIVMSITGVTVRERIPDKVFDSADEVQLVDVEPRELMERLSQGKIYKAAQAQRALGNFFSEENLTALREIALRRTADRVNIITEKAKKLSGNEYYTEEKILVGISPSPSNPKIIRAAARMANAFGGVFVGIFVETPGFENMNQEDRKRLQNHIHLATQLGANIETVCGDDIASTIAEYAKISGISKIVVGKSSARRNYFLKQSFAEKLSFLASNIDIYIIPDSTVPNIKQKFKRRYTDGYAKRDLGISIVILCLVTGIGLFFHSRGIKEANIITLYILGAMISGIITSNRVTSILISALNVIVFNFFLTEPRYSLQTYDAGYSLTFLVMFLSAFISSNLAAKMKLQTESLAKTAYRTRVLLDTNQLLQKEKELDGIGRITCNQLLKLLNRDIVFYQGIQGVLQEPAIYFTEDSDKCKDCLSDSEKAVAAWVFKNNKHAGATTGTLESSRCYYLAIRNTSQVYGVIGIRMDEGDTLEAFERNLLFAILAETAEVMEKEILRRNQEEAKEQANSEKLRANLLRSISHDLRTPLTSISGNAGMMLENSFDEAATKKICMDIYDDSMWLINLVENLLSVTRIEEGTMQIKKHAEMLEDIIKEALKHVNRKSSEYTIRVLMENEMQLVNVDPRLIVQVFINIIDNAIKYTPVGSKIFIRTRKIGKMVRVSIVDNGGGISDENKRHIFDMFYTANGQIVDSRRNLGLGLALCKSIVTAHGGEISVGDNKPQGSIFNFTLEAWEAEIHE